jgi:hypothetical protein
MSVCGVKTLSSLVTIRVNAKIQKTSLGLFVQNAHQQTKQQKKMKDKIFKTIEFKKAQLQEVLKLQKTETQKSKLNDLDKNEIEIKAQISILQYLLY